MELNIKIKYNLKIIARSNTNKFWQPIIKNLHNNENKSTFFIFILIIINI